jgi:hypothetical protein
MEKNLQLEIQKFSRNILLEILKKSYIFQSIEFYFSEDFFLKFKNISGFWLPADERRRAAAEAKTSA